MKTSRTAQLPPFYTQVIGSLPRPLVVRDLLAARSTLPAEEYGRRMDDMVRFAIRLQEQAGLDVISDGEWRRVQYVSEFLDRIGGFAPVWRMEHAGEVKYHRVVVKRIAPGESVFRADARFLVQHTRKVTKFALPSPFLIAIRYWHPEHSRAAYPTVERFMEHLGEVLAVEAKAVAEEGIDIVQLDDPALTYFCDRQLMAGESSHDSRLRREWDVEKQFPEAMAAISAVTAGLKAEVHLHCCHSVYKRHSDVTGDYKPILPRLKGAPIDRVNLEFAYADTGAISDLDFLPAGLGIGLGVVDVRTESPQSVEEIAAIGAAAAARIAPERIALNPDCGFAPDSGEPPTIDEAFTKLQRLSEAGRLLRSRFAAAAGASPKRA